MDKPLTARDYASDQDIRWCPGCGDFAILKQVQTVLPKLGVPKEKTVFISGIGCSSRFPYYMNTYGIHSIHGRAPAFATGLKVANPELDVWIITGDGDALSIGGNHFIHLFRRNVNLNILLFNNKIYGLTKGQYSPTSEVNKVTKSTPFGSIDYPFNPAALALGAEATFVARTIDREAKHQQAVLTEAHQHKGTSFVEIYQNCNVFNDGAFVQFTDRATRKDAAIFVEDGQPLVFGANNEKGIILDGTVPKVVNLEDGYSLEDLWIHDKSDRIKANILSLFYDNSDEFNLFPRPFGIFFQKNRLCYEDEITNQIASNQGGKDNANLESLILGKKTWKV